MMLERLKRLRLMLLPALWLATAAATPPSANPHIVMQNRAPSGVEVAAWTPDDKYLLTATGLDHELTIWDVADRRVIDRATLPADITQATDLLRLETIEVTADGREAIVHGVASDLDRTAPPRARDFRVDLATRAVTVLPPRALPPKTGGIEALAVRAGAMAVVYQGAETMTLAQATASLPPLPRSHDGRFAVTRARDGPRLTGGGQAFTLAGPEAIALDDAALSPDGRVLAIIGDREEAESGTNLYVTRVTRFNVATGMFLPRLELAGDYGYVRWLDGERLLLTSSAVDTDRDTADDPDTKLPLSPTLVIDATSGKTLQSVPGRCFVAPLGTGFVGADAANCRNGLPANSTISVATPAWTKLQDLPGYKIDALATSHDGNLVAITGADATATNEIVVIDVNKGKLVDSFSWPKGFHGVITNAAFTDDDKALIIAANGGAQIWPFGVGAPRVIAAKTSAPQLVLSGAGTVFLSGVADSAIVRARLADGTALPPLDLPAAIAGGFLKDRPIFWAAAASGELRFWDTRDWHLLLTSYQIAGGHHVTVTPEGRYDTDLGPDADAFRWIVPDAPFQSLPAQTFMRDYFTPRLAQKLLDCTGAGTCATVLPALPSLTSLNRVLPEVRIVTVAPTNPGFTTVYVEVKEGVNAAAANGRTHSGVYNVRLFRNGRLVDNAPDERNEALHQTLAEWRKSNGWDGGADASGTSQFQFEIPLPTGPGADQQVFTAYAFNEDRVKSETARYAYTAPPVPPRPRRAYIVTIGIDAYDDPRLKLNFSAADAKLMGERLGAIPGYEVHHFDLTSATLPDGRIRKVTFDVIRAAFLQLVGAGDFPGMRDLLKDFDTTGIAQVTPDDLVIVTWSGHGWANPQGDFFLVPADAKWPADQPPDQSTLISAADLTMFLRAVRAGEMAFVIDACHSAASVDAAAFKPGPMGDPGLGQLAYDKGMRILAATQSDDVALEDPRLGQGLLTYALAAEGLATTGGRADENRDGRITLDEWLRYAVTRLPTLSADVKLGKLATARGFRKPGVAARTQEPALFDFTGAASPVVLKTVAK